MSRGICATIHEIPIIMIMVIRCFGRTLLKPTRSLLVPINHNSSNACIHNNSIQLLDKTYNTDHYTNVTPKILSYPDRKIYLQKYHPLSLMRQRVVDYFYDYKRRKGNPVFSVYDQLNPVVTLEQNFDSLLVPKDHPSRKKSDSYYLNQEFMLRAHTSAHQTELIRMGFDHFLMIGDVYRRDEINATHYPVFHQVDGVNIMEENEIKDLVRLNHNQGKMNIFENGTRTAYKQELHTTETSKVLETDLKNCLIGLARSLFGKGVEYRFVEAYFPFTHPSWELEIRYQGKWMEMLGCGIMEQRILADCGIEGKSGWAFGLGLERLAMKLFEIPDIRLFWSTDSGFLNQFVTDDKNKKIIYKPISKYPQTSNDLSFWLPKDGNESSFCHNDFYELVREVGGDLVEQMSFLDEYKCKKTERTSLCFRIVYRSLDRTLEKTEVNEIHSNIEERMKEQYNVTIR